MCRAVKGLSRSNMEFPEIKTLNPTPPPPHNLRMDLGFQEGAHGFENPKMPEAFHADCFFCHDAMTSFHTRERAQGLPELPRVV